MAKRISAWKIARGILSTCESRTDIGAVAEALQNSQMREELIRILLAVSNALESQVSLIPKKVSELDNDVRYSPEALLCNLFRERLKMSNKDVEKWLADKFRVSRRIGKSSLREYLGAVVKSDPAGIGRAILSQASKDFSSVLGSNPDLRMFWDGLDARAKEYGNASIQPGTREIPSKSEESGSFRE